MRVTVRLFAVARQLAGRESLEVELPEGSTVGQLRGQLGRECPDLVPVLPHVLFAINADYAADDRVVSDGNDIGHAALGHPP